MRNRWLISGWFFLLLTLLLAGGGLWLRVSNENQNRAVITVIDYREFWKTADAADMELDEVLKQLKESGVTHVGIKETSLRDLAYSGEIYLSPWGEFMAFNRNYAPELEAAARRAVGEQVISPDKLVLCSDRPDTIRFLQKQLASRFQPEELLSFKADGQSYFIINAELLPLDKPKDPKKPANEFVEVDARLGFDDRVLDRLKAGGFNIVLRPDNSMGSNDAYLQEYEELVGKYDVKYLVFGNEVSGAPDRLEVMEDLVKKYGLIIGIIETPVQLKYVEQKGLDELMVAAAYPINRLYSTTNDEFVQTTDERYYRWVRAVVDRGIRILYVSPFKDRKVSYSENINNTQEVIERFHAAIQGKGFTIDQPLPHLSSEQPGPWQQLALSMSLLLAGTLYLFYLFRPGRRFIILLLGLGIAGCLLCNLVVGMDLAKVYALAAAILYPSLSSLLLLIYLRNHREQALASKLLAGLAIILGVNALGMLTVVSSLADIRYIMNVKVFSGVKLAFIMPLLLFVVNYFACFAGEEGFKEKVMGFLRMNPNYLVLFTLGVAVLALYYYLGRSGNNPQIAVSSLELRFREVLESVFLARPRFKEIIIGYPSLFALVYLYHRYKEEVILLVLGFGVVMGSISMVNSFCHVFTAVTISANRTLAGLLVGVFFALLALLGIGILEWILRRCGVIS
ncbi:DUF5693 family protein [Syntrophomonas wolfei]|uniref:DUF5693 family protein n=1 Tax=Syntrophomonas wolfei TaxID=863 RepID=UPI000774A034|nr:DUF5693 family protein [Syntrophomonas wolfei]